VWCVAALETAAAGLEIVASSQTFAVEACQEFRGGVSVEVGEAESVGCYIPSGAEPEEVGERGVGVAGFGGQDGVDRWVCVVDAGRVLGCELGKVVLEIMSGKRSISVECKRLPCRERHCHAMQPSRTGCDPAPGSCTFHCSC
jgi:hypothetical protein